MKKFGIRLLAVLLVCCLPLGASADIGGLSRLLSEYFGAGQDVYMSVGFELEEMVPYGAETVEMMNGILRHTTLDAQVSGKDVHLSMCVDGEKVFSLNETENDGSWQLVTDLLPNRILTAAESPLSVLFPEETNTSFSLERCLKEAGMSYEALTDAILPFAEEKEANYKIEKIGYAKWVRLAKLDSEQAQQLLPQIRELLGCGMDESFREELKNMTFAKGLTIALYRTEEGGDNIAVYMKGTANFAENDNRTLSYLWAFTTSEGQRKDSYKLELIKTKGSANKHTIECLRTVAADDSQLAYTCNSQYTRRLGNETHTVVQKDSLNGVPGSEPALGGTITETHKTTIGESTVTVVTEYKPELTLKSFSGGSVLTGSIGYTVTKSQKQQTALTVLLGNEPLMNGDEQEIPETAREVGNEVVFTIDGGSLSQNEESLSPFLVGAPPVGVTMYTPPQSAVKVDLDKLTSEEMAALEEEMFQYAAGYLLRVLPFINQEDAGLLQDNMTQEDYDAYVHQAENIE